MKRMSLAKKTALILFLSVFSAAGFYGVRLTGAFEGPAGTAGTGSGAISADSSNNLSIGTTTVLSDTRLFIQGANSATDKFAIQLKNLEGRPMFVLRNDGRMIVGPFPIGNPPTFTTSTLLVRGMIETVNSTDPSLTGGIRFPDGTTQTTAGGSTVSAANVSAGSFGANTGGGNYTFPASLGVGAAPQTALHIQTTTADSVRVHRPGSTANVVYSAINDAGATYFGRPTTNFFAVGPNLNLSTSPYFSIDTSGKIGVGTVSPDETLSIVGSGSWPIGITTVDTISRGGSAADDGLITVDGDLLLQLDDNNNQTGNLILYDGTEGEIFRIEETGKTTFDVGRGDVYFENNSNDNANGAGITLRVSSNPTTGAMFAVRSSGQAARLWVGQDITSSGQNPFYVGTDITGRDNATIKLNTDGTASFNGTVTVSTPTSGSHAATKDYVDTAAGVQYMGRTTQTYTGSLGFMTGANAKCQVDFPGSHMCTLGEMLRSGKTVFGNSGDTSTLFSWAACDVVHGSNSEGCDTAVFSYIHSSDGTCSSWNGNSSLQVGLVVRNDGWPSNTACNSSRSIHCCK